MHTIVTLICDLHNLNRNNVSMLGKGSAGVVYECDNKIIKITQQKEEAIACSIIKNNPVDGVYKIHEVYKFDSSYIILMDKYNKDYMRSTLLIMELMAILRRLYPKTSEKYFTRSHFYVNEVIAVLREHADDEILKIALAMNSLYNLGILYNDLYPGNLLYDNKDKPVICDLGYSKVVLHANYPPIKELL